MMSALTRHTCVRARRPCARARRSRHPTRLDAWRRAAFARQPARADLLVAYAAPRASPAWMASAVQIRSATSSPTISVIQWSGRARAECRAGAARAAGTAKAPPCRRLSAISPRNAGQARLRHAALPGPCRSSIFRRSWRRQVAQARFEIGAVVAWRGSGDALGECAHAPPASISLCSARRAEAGSSAGGAGR